MVKTNMSYIVTNKGTFKVRYAYNNNGVVTLVIRDDRGLWPFDGEHGDEIPITKEAYAKYEVSKVI